MKKINIAITGGLGKMGQKIINSSKKDKKFKITSITESKVLNKKVSGLKLQINSKNAFKDHGYLFLQNKTENPFSPKLPN